MRPHSTKLPGLTILYCDGYTIKFHACYQTDPGWGTSLFDKPGKWKQKQDTAISLGYCHILKKET